MENMFERFKLTLFSIFSLVIMVLVCVLISVVERKDKNTLKVSLGLEGARLAG